jgi:hypothetical protein
MRSKFSRILITAAVLLLAPIAAYASATFAITGTGATAAQVIYEGQAAQARIMEIRAEGTWGDTTITMETKARGSSVWIAMPSISLTADKVTYLYLVPGDSVRLTATGGSGISVVVRIR